jgi:hypothetical protein
MKLSNPQALSEMNRAEFGDRDHKLRQHQSNNPFRERKLRETGGEVSSLESGESVLLIGRGRSQRGRVIQPIGGFAAIR